MAARIAPSTECPRSEPPMCPLRVICERSSRLRLPVHLRLALKADLGFGGHKQKQKQKARRD